MDNPGFSPPTEIVSDIKQENSSGRTPETKNIQHEEDTAPNMSGLLYTVEEVPPAGVTFFSALQVIFGTISGILSTAFLVYMNICAVPNTQVLVKLISTSLFFVGIVTFLQVTFGLRLPVIQGSSQVFLIPILILAKMKKCPVIPNSNSTFFINGTYTGDPNDLEPWNQRLGDISGSLAAASCTQVLLGATGLIGILTRFIGPLTVTPLISMIALSLAEVVVITSRYQWGVALLTAFLIMFFNVILGKVQVPCFSWSKKSGCHVEKIQVFRIFANIFAICICWILCLVLTLTNQLSDDPKVLSYRARTDVKLQGLRDAPWIFFPYPGQWGPLTLSAPTTIGMLAGVCASIIESIGDYRVTAFSCRVPPPPRHAVNRAVMIEGLGSMLSGAFGAGHATTTYSQIMGIISYTGVASRIVCQVAGIIYLVAGLIGKVGGVLALVPDPIIGGTYLISTGMILSSAIAALRTVNMKLPRNLMVLGVSIMMGSAVPIFSQQNPDAFQTDSTGVLEVILTNGPLIAGVIGCFLDNILPGSRKDRGFRDDSEEEETFEPVKENEKDPGGLEVYNFNFPCCKNVSGPSFLKYIPISPQYDEDICACRGCKKSYSP